jgi:hypothetical protein
VIKGTKLDFYSVAIPSPFAHRQITWIQSRSQSMPVRGLGSGMTREQAYSGNETGMHINLADTT